MIKMIVAVDKNNLIGDDNGLVWHIPEDLKFFKRTTYDQFVVMGRKTFESLKGPLSNRINLILTRDKNYKVQYPNCLIFNSVEEIITSYRMLNKTIKDLFIIGGSEIYQLFLPYTDMIYLTEIQHEFEGNKYFPELDPKEWILQKSDIHHGEFELHFKTYIKNKSI